MSEEKISIDKAKLENFLGICATCQKDNTIDWLEYFAEHINIIISETGNKKDYVAVTRQCGLTIKQIP